MPPPPLHQESSHSYTEEHGHQSSGRCRGTTRERDRCTSGVTAGRRGSGQVGAIIVARSDQGEVGTSESSSVGCVHHDRTVSKKGSNSLLGRCIEIDIAKSEVSKKNAQIFHEHDAEGRTYLVE